jgi:hypothetical protein
MSPQVRLLLENSNVQYIKTEKRTKKNSMRNPRRITSKITATTPFEGFRKNI